MTKFVVLTKAGIERRLRPDLEGVKLTYESVHALGACVMNVRCPEGHLVAHYLSFKGEEPSVRLFDWRKFRCLTGNETGPK